jgi:regulatory protein YycH of two-component signal transduction system YycFG
MNKEHIKTIVLTTLVIISLVLSYSLWSYQPAYDLIQKQDYVQNVSIGSKEDYRDIIVPYELILHREDKHLVTNKENEIYTWYRLLQKNQITDLKNISNQTSEQQYENLTTTNNRIEYVFPVSVPIETLKRVLKIDSKRVENISFDKIVIDFSKEHQSESAIYFVNNNLKLIYQGKINVSSYRSAINKINEGTNNFEVYKEHKLENGKIVYLPIKRKTLNTIEFLTADIQVDKLKDAIFIDPANVRKENSESGDTYTDGTRLMTVSQFNQSITFVNPTSIEEANENADSLIQRSVDFINGHGGWTDRYYLTDINPMNNQVGFRLFVNNMPVFKNSTISTQWGRDDLTTFKRPLYRLGYKGEESSIDLLSGDELIRLINQDKMINKSLINGIFIGYETVYNTDESMENQFYRNSAIQLQPVWVIKYDNSYKKVEQNVLSRTGVKIVGLE